MNPPYKGLILVPRRAGARSARVEAVRVEDLLDPVLKYGKFLGTNAILGPHLGTRKRVVLAQKMWVFILCQDVLG